MFLGYYKATNNSEGSADITCLIGRSSLKKSNKSVKFNKQLLVPNESGEFPIEGNRLLTMCQGQDIYPLTNIIDEDIAIASNQIISQLKEYKEENPNKKASLLMSVETYKPSHMFYLDWLDSYSFILEEDTRFLVGLTYMKYKLRKGDSISIIESTFDLIVYP